MTRTAVTIPNAPVPIPNAPVPAGPYSHGVVAGGFLFTAGFGPQDPATGEVVAGGVYEQTQQVLRNIQKVLATSGATMDDVVKVTAHLEHLDRDFAEYNRAYAEFFTAPYPVRTTARASPTSSSRSTSSRSSPPLRAPTPRAEHDLAAGARRPHAARRRQGAPRLGGGHGYHGVRRRRRVRGSGRARPVGRGAARCGGVRRRSRRPARDAAPPVRRSGRSDRHRRRQRLPRCRRRRAGRGGGAPPPAAW